MRFYARFMPERKIAVELWHGLIIMVLKKRLHFKVNLYVQFYEK